MGLTFSAVPISPLPFGSAQGLSLSNGRGEPRGKVALRGSAGSLGASSGYDAKPNKTCGFLASPPLIGIRVNQ